MNKKRFKRRKVSKSNMMIVLFLILVLSSGYILFNIYYQRYYLDSNKISINNIIKKEKSKKIAEYLEKYNDSTIETFESINNFVCLLYKDNDKKLSKCYDYYSGNEITKDNLVINKDEFNNKIKELLYLKYPTFIADKLINNEDNTYYFGAKELIIYYYNYNIIPTYQKELSLKVNYNEIKDYLNFKIDNDLEYVNEDGYTINEGEKVIAITFDDGPGPYTKTLVNYLKNNKAHATFFMLGNRLKSYESAVVEVNNNGNEIGYHSYNHTSLVKQNANTIKNELATSNEILNSIIGKTFSIYRPPYGALNDNARTAMGMPAIIWSVDTNDWQAQNKNAVYLKNYVLSHVNDGDIVLFHDIHPTSVEAMKDLLPELYARGYRVVTVSELAKLKNKELNQPIKYYSFR